MFRFSYEPRQANLCLRAFCHDKFSLRMPSHSEGPGIWLSVWRFLLTHCLYERAAKVLARLRGCAGSPEPSLLAQAISTKFAWRGPYAFGRSFVYFGGKVLITPQAWEHFDPFCKYTNITFFSIKANRDSHWQTCKGPWQTYHGLRPPWRKRQRETSHGIARDFQSLRLLIRCS